MLHGSVSRDLTDDVNVVVTTMVGSKKYLVGSNRKLHILLPDWITEAWRLSEIQDPVDMMLRIYTEKYRVPIFSQLVICVSGLSVEERKEVSDLVSKHGGRYSSVMRIGETTHLITQQASGTKYIHAKKWKIQIIRIQWLIDSVNKGYALDVEDYRVDQPKTKSSTPTSNTHQNNISFDNISAISYVGGASRIDETRSMCSRESVQGVNIQNDISILSGCTIRFFNCNKDETQLYSSIVRQLGGKLCTELFDQVTEILTHVVVGSVSNSNCITKENSVKYVNGAWLLACRDLGVRAVEDEYLIRDINEDCQKFEDNVDVTVTTVDAADIQLINQYFAGDLAGADEFNDNAIETRGFVQGFDETSTKPGTVNVVKHPEASETVCSSGCFSNLVFSFHKELNDVDISEYTCAIKIAGGSVSNDEKRVNFLVTPFFVFSLPHTGSYEFVTVAWISYCIHEKRLCLQEISKEYAFKPVLRKQGPPPLSGCVISLSGFVGNDRCLLTSYAQALGATVQECFLRKSVASRNLSASTHLIAAKPDGRKWPAAQQWGLPAVSRLWLYKCAETWSLVDESEFPVSDETKNHATNNHKDLAVNLKEIRVEECAVLKNSDFPKLACSVADESPKHNLALSNLAETMQTPDWLQDFRESRLPELNSSIHSSSFPYKPSPTFSAQVSRCLKNAVKETSALPKRKLELSGNEEDGLCLRGVVICVAKHLSSRQVELNEIVKKLGGDFKWTYNPQACTHMISETSPDDVLSLSTPSSSIPFTPNVCTGEQPHVYPDVIAAKKDGKFLVNPKWLISCMEACCRLPEIDFPPYLGEKASVSTSPVEPRSKVARTASVNLFGDVNRRLEMMLTGSKSNVEEGINSGTNGDSQLLNTEVLSELVQGQNIANNEVIKTPLAPAPTDKRRFRRNPRRGNCSVIPHSDTNIASHESKYDSNNDISNDKSKIGKLNGVDNVDLVQPDQKMTVQWKYEDNALHHQLKTTSTDLVISRATYGEKQSENIIGQTLLKENVTQRSDNQSSFKSPIKQHQQQPSCLSPKSSYVVSFTGLSLDERDRYAEIVERLGGEVDNQTTLSERTTHLIVHTPTRSEKCLICLASGKWMLHKSYLDACSRESRWVDEEAYEWGGPGTEPLLVQLSPLPRLVGGSTTSYQQKSAQIRDLAKSARRWRLSGGKAFHNWKVIFGPGCDKESSFRRVIEAGGGKVLASNPPYPPAHEVTHAFFKTVGNSNSSLSALPSNYSWLRIDYLCSYLSSGQEVSKSEFML
ncbi:DNA topoisomerase 2-binding protein [Schistosoma japonicum]|uniref:DNA topoisomerase 2-binding protein n=1 Tax=Schistosoma japonicum TaxID=6182 RepID=A0A4Z2CSN7_SCHJA|nr:DNA topoisomerase 2-binding protein [Schistosoma japonicum]